MRAFRAAFRLFLVGRGYSVTQSRRLVGGIPWAKIKELIKEYGPQLLKIFLALLPLILAKEKPQGKASKANDKDFDYALSVTELQDIEDHDE